MSKKEVLEKLSSKEVKDVFLENHIEHIYLFGSYARGEQKENSDIDIIYEEPKNSKFSLFDLIEMKNTLEKKMLCKLDIVENNSINKHYKDYIDKDKILVF